MNTQSKVDFLKSQPNHVLWDKRTVSTRHVYTDGYEKFHNFTLKYFVFFLDLWGLDQYSLLKTVETLDSH